MDVVIVPNSWYENSPLTIQETFIGGAPVITADRGGMAELVRDGADGLHFRIGDAASLRERLQSVFENPRLLDELRKNIPKEPEIAAQAAIARTLYEVLLSNRSEPPERLWPPKS